MIDRHERELPSCEINVRHLLPRSGSAQVGCPSGRTARQPAGQVRVPWGAEAPLCQAAVPAAAAVLACAHLILACSLGGTSISWIHRRVAENRCVPPTARPARAIRAPAPKSAAPVTIGPVLSSGQLLLLLSVLVDMAPSRKLVVDRYSHRTEETGHPPLRVVAPPAVPQAGQKRALLGIGRMNNCPVGGHINNGPLV